MNMVSKVSKIIDKIIYAQVYKYAYEIVMHVPYSVFKNLNTYLSGLFKDDGFFEKHIYDNGIYR